MDGFKMIDNKHSGTVGEELKNHVMRGSKLSVVSAYFTIYAFQELHSELKKIDQMRFIFTEPSFVKKGEEEKRQYMIQRGKESQISGNEFEIKLRNELNQAHIAKECANWLRNKVEIKSFCEPNPAQQRSIFVENGEHNLSINGTVDFTADGLGFVSSNRNDMNACITGKETTFQFLEQFNELWKDDSKVIDVKEKVLQRMESIYKENTPQFIYFVTLYHIFYNYLDELTEERIVKTKTGFKDSVIWNKLYKFQKDGAMGIIDKIEKYNGCILADSVGLGKTYTALAVIKYYELRNDRVLVLAPKKLRENWTVYTMNDKRNILVDDRFNYDVLNHTDLSRYGGYSGENNLEMVNWSNYDLIVIDESHNFRNNNPRKDRITRYARMMEDVIKAGVKTKILMLSATPVNNRMNDLKNQIAFITEGDDRALQGEGIENIEHTLRKAQLVFNRWSDLPEEVRTVDRFVEMINLDYFKLLDTVTIARSRKHIEKYYSMKEIGKFPERNKPVNIYSEIDIKNEFPPLSDINKVIKNLNMSSYSPLKYVLAQKRPEYDKKYDTQVKDGKSVFRQVDREQSLINLMRISILKRMESSIHSFGMTISKLLRTVDALIEKIDQHEREFNTDLSILDIDLEDEEFNEMLIGTKVKVLLQDMDLIRWRQDLGADRDQLEHLLIEAVKITNKRDAKLNELKELISKKIENPLNADNKKVLIFTAFADTAEYLYAEIADWAKQKYRIHSGLVTGKGNNQTTFTGIRRDLNSMLTNFSPRSKERDKLGEDMGGEIDLLIATDCISEGQNLQDCDYLINYDIHWNPVRIIQRFGRIDRIGSINKRIQLINFWPYKDLDEYINLEARVTGRMVLLDISATGEENLIEFDKKKQMNDLEYRKKQLRRLQEEVVDLEDIAGGISITDMTMNDFKMDLMEFLKENRGKLKCAPMGMYAVVSNGGNGSQDVLKPGAIFALKQVNPNARPEENNALYPYYMVYVYEDGTVEYSYLHTKRILDFYKKLCASQDQVQMMIVERFNQGTKDGRDMRKYSELLEQGIQSIIGKTEEKGVASLFSKGGTTLQKNLFHGVEDFELISFLVIK
jgi:SNF2 family DNA or RNA helicase